MGYIEDLADASAGTAIQGVQNMLTGNSSKAQQKRAHRQAMDQMTHQYNLGQLGADAAQERNREMFDYTLSKTNVKALADQYEEAGFNRFLAVTGGTGGAGGRAEASGGQPANISAPQRAPTDTPGQVMMANLALGRQRAEVENIRASTDKANAEADKLRAEKNRITNTDDEFKENLRQQGIEVWIRNKQSDFKMAGPSQEGGGMEATNPQLRASLTINGRSYFTRETAAAAARAVQEAIKAEKEVTTEEERADMLEAIASLTSQKAQTHWMEVLNAIKVGDSTAAKNNAQALAEQHGIGEYVNWRTYVDVGEKVLEAATKALGR